jgi:hypothetical protein
MAAALCRGEGVALLADDTVALEGVGAGFQVIPTEPRHRLLEDTARHLGFSLPAERAQKAQNLADCVANGPAELGAVVMLAPDDRASVPRIRRLSANEAFLGLTRQLFRFVFDEPEVDLRDFELVCDVVRAVPVYELARTASLSDLDGSVKLVLDQLAIAGILE